MVIRLNIDFLLTDDVEKVLKRLSDKEGMVDSHTASIELAKMGMTLYGGTATYHANEGGGEEIRLGLTTQQSGPVYQITFTTGRGNKFTAVKPAASLEFNSNNSPIVGIR